MLHAKYRLLPGVLSVAVFLPALESQNFSDFSRPDVDASLSGSLGCHLRYITESPCDRRSLSSDSDRFDAASSFHTLTDWSLDPVASCVPVQFQSRQKICGVLLGGLGFG